MNDSNGDQDQALYRALRQLPRAAPDPALDRRVRHLAAAELGRTDMPGSGAGPASAGRRLAAVVAPALLALLVASYFGWSVCFLLASRMARLG
jgi:hypothetical protein